jgi:Zn-finger nucleic acid-binding protein
MSSQAPASSRLTCPRCGLEVRTRRRSVEDECCPRCIAQSAGALSIRLERRAGGGESSERAAALQRVARLARGVRARVSF